MLFRKAGGETGRVARELEQESPDRVAQTLIVGASVATLGVVSPLNSAVLGNIEESVCFSCLLIIYASAFAGVVALAWGARYVAGDRGYVVSVKVMTLCAVIAFLNTIQKTTIAEPYKPYFVVFCVVCLLPMILSLRKRSLTGYNTFLSLILIVSLYEAVNLARIGYGVSQAQPSVEARAVTPLDGGSGEKPHVFILLLDEFALTQVIAEETLDERRVPALKEFSKAATWYRKAASPYTVTAYAVPSLLTGKIGKRFEDVFIGSDEKDHLFKRSAKTHRIFINGYAVPYCEAFAQYAARCKTFRRGLSTYRFLFLTWWERAIPGELRRTGLLLPVRNAVARMFPAPTKERVEPLKKALQLGQDFREATFTYIHTELPHSPYIFSEDGTVRWDPLNDRKLEEADQEELTEFENRYRSQIRFTDRLVGGVISEIRAAGVYDESLIVITSDHGMSFTPGRAGRKQEWIEDEQIRRIPLFVKWPGQRDGEVLDCEISLPKVYSVVVDVLEGEPAKRSQDYCLAK